MNTAKIKLIIAAISFALLGAACTPGNIQTTAADGGIWLTQDRGEAWQPKNNIYIEGSGSKTIANTNIKKIFFSPRDTRKIFAITERDGLWVSWNAANNWDMILASSKINDVKIDPIDTKIIYAAVEGAIAKTVDEGVIWKAIYTSDNPQVLITSLAQDPKKLSNILAATSEGDILISENSGTSWREFSSPGITLYDMQFHPGRNETIYAHASGVGLTRSRDSGKTWEYFDKEFALYPGANNFRDFVLVPSGVVYASQYGLLRSLNHGRDWVSLPLISGKNDANIYALAVNPDDPLELYYGTRSNFYISIDGGFNWIPRQLPSTRGASDILINPDDPSIIYLGVNRSI